jgi:EEF1A lysine methyltransferase 4
MASPDDDKSASLAHPQYWDERYANEKEDDKSHEWFREYKDLVPFLEKRLFSAYPPQNNPRILHLGAGKSVGTAHGLFSELETC